MTTKPKGKARGGRRIKSWPPKKGTYGHRANQPVGSLSEIRSTKRCARISLANSLSWCRRPACIPRAGRRDAGSTIGKSILRGPEPLERFGRLWSQPAGTVRIKVVFQPWSLLARKEAEMPESVYKVIELVGASPESWEKATANAVKQAAKSLRDLRVAEVIQMDAHIGADGSIESYRTKIRVSFKYEGEG